jgi:predicted dithiol-disulfide oxidoreductase (DUF899 family)
MSNQTVLVPAGELAAKSQLRFPHESKEYRDARNALLKEEIELRRQIERVAAQRRALPIGGKVNREYVFEGENGPRKFAELFEGKQTLVLYSYMFGPERERPCPMCTSVLSAWDAAAPNVNQRVTVAVVARSPIGRLVDFKKERGWRFLKLYSDMSGDYTRTYVDPKDGDAAGLSVFTHRGGDIYHFWSGEMNGEMADPGQDPRGAPDIDPLWTIFDLTPEGRGVDWYPKLDYPKKS